MPTPEADVLHPVDRSITDSDDWEIFTLSDARVSYESNGRPASLLAAYADTLLRVEGRLETPARAQSHYRGFQIARESIPKHPLIRRQS